MSIAQQYPEGSQQYRQLRNQENYAVAQAAGLTQQAGGAPAGGLQAGGLQAGGLQAGAQAGGFGGLTAAGNAYGLNPGVAGRAGRQFVGNTIADQLASQFLAQQAGRLGGGLTQQAGGLAQQAGGLGGGLTD